MDRPPATYLVCGAALRKTRMSLGLTIAQLATRAGISRTHLNQLELGIKRNVRPPTYSALRAACELPPDDSSLLADEEPQREE